MTDKAYIVANEQQEHEVLEKLEKDGFMWTNHANKPTELVPSIEVSKQFPYAIVIDRGISLKLSNYFEHYEIVFDGRKEYNMSEKYVVSQVFLNELKDWKKRGNTDVYFVGSYDISMLPIDVIRWWDCPEINNFEQNNRLIAIIRWVNGEDVFEVEKPKKWVVRSKETDEYGDYRYIYLADYAGITNIKFVAENGNATKFNAKEEAESWANSHQEVVEVVDV